MDSDNYLVSLLVPVYNVEPFIERCARSLFEQTYSNLEFVFVDDCSTDHSIDLLNQVVHEYPERATSIKYTRHDHNRGLAAARNTALLHSSGSFVCLVDSDDWLEPDSIESLIKRQQEENSDIVYGNRLIHEQGKEVLLKAEDYHSKDEMVLRMMQRTWDHLITGKLIRESLFTDNGLKWNEGFDVAEDRYMMTLLAYYADSCAILDEGIVYHYEQRNPRSLTRAKDKQTVLSNNRQELGNILELESFFKVKEDVFSQECTRCVMEQLLINRHTAIRLGSKGVFHEVIGTIDGRSEADKQMIGWGKSVIKDWAKHHYGLMRILSLMRVKSLLRS